MDLLWFAQEHNVPLADVAQVMGLTEVQVKRAFDDFTRKLRGTEYLRLAPVDITGAAESNGSAARAIAKGRDSLIAGVSFLVNRDDAPDVPGEGIVPRASRAFAGTGTFLSTAPGDLKAIILEGTAEEIKDRSVWKQLAQIYNAKYGGDVEPLLMASDGCVYRITPQLAFGQDEHAENFADAMTRWHF